MPEETDESANPTIRVDVLGEPFVAETIALPDDDEGAVVATLVSSPADPAVEPTGRAVLHVHGFADYFFQRAHAEWWNARGYAFHALDLRKYGRSLLPHQTPAYVADLADHFPEIDAAWQRITERDGHREVVVSAHSTGGLVMSLWADDRQPVELVGSVLNSPWLDLQGGTAVRAATGLLIDQVGSRQPKREIKRAVTGFYARSLHQEHDGEWDFDLALKPIGSFPVRAGWLRAIRAGHARVHRGLEVPGPVLVLASARSSVPVEMNDEVHSTDIVLDADQIRRWSSNLGRHVTYVGIDGARHDVTLSLPLPRARVYDELGRWLTAYVDG